MDTDAKHSELSWGIQVNLGNYWQYQRPRYPSWVRNRSERDRWRELGLVLYIEVRSLGFELYRIASRTTYAQASLATEQALRLWGQSRIAFYHQEKDIPAAAFGIEEVGIKYRTWLGNLGDWPELQEDRGEYMATACTVLPLSRTLKQATILGEAPIRGDVYEDQVVRECQGNFGAPKIDRQNQLPVESELPLRVLG